MFALKFRAYPLVALCLFWPALTAAQANAPLAPGYQPESPGDCALIEEAVQRLACYDSFSNPQISREEASPERIQGVEGGNSNAVNNGVTTNLVDQKVSSEKALFSFSGSFISYKPTYLMPFTWVDQPNASPSNPRLGTTGYDYDLENEEAKYQISFKVPLLTGLLNNRTTFWFGYTQKSFWQVFNKDDSAPFRETNYEPELFLRHQSSWSLGPFNLEGLTIGFNHQSNGQSEPRSRSWNRIVGSAVFTHDRWLLAVQPWYRIKEDNRDDNEDIERFLGNAAYNIVYKLTEDSTVSLQLMNNLRSDNHTSMELGYSFPIGGTIKGFFQYYNGYGESLIDYNHRIERFGLGIMLNDWL